MTGKADFSEEEWKQVLEGPPSAGMIVIASDRGGSIRESFSMAKAYAEARAQHGESQLLDEIVSAKPEVDSTRFQSPEELREHCLENIRQAVELVGDKGGDHDLQEYRDFVQGLAKRVAEARKEGFMGLSGERVSSEEEAALADIESALG
jgi:hypothetical protein